MGGTGYVATAGKTTFRGRLANDLLRFSPNVIIWAGGINDSAALPATVQSAALPCYQAAEAQFPNVVQIVLSPFWPAGVETFNANLLDVKAATKAAVAAANTQTQPVFFLDLMERPLDSTPLTGTRAASSTVGATTLSSSVQVPKGATIEIDSGSNRERRVVTGVSGVGPYSLTVAAMTLALAPRSRRSGLAT